MTRIAFPQGLLDWAGHRAGGVRRLFYDGAGRPSDSLIETALLARLRDWAAAVATTEPHVPRVLLLVGGPGNGKTEAIEATIRELEACLGTGTAAQDKLRPLFNPEDGSTVPRAAVLALASPERARSLTLMLVQDASVSDAKQPGKTASELLADDLERALAAGTDHLYLACVNRGVLDGALIAATEAQADDTRRLLEAVVRASGIDPQAPKCWPLDGFPEVAVWPMDVESLVKSYAPASHEVQLSPAAQLLQIAIEPLRWPEFGTCAAGKRCPHCSSRQALGNSERQEAFLRVLRWYELASGKRWSFRDLLSLTSYCLAGAPDDETDSCRTPCESATYLIELDANPGKKGNSMLRHAAPFLLVAAQYQHALFGEWPKLDRRGIKSQLRELQIEDDKTLLGLQYFLMMDRAESIPTTLRSQLASLCQLLDPALADPDEEVAVSSKTILRLGDIDARFSSGLREGLNFVRPYHALTELETDLISRLAAAEEKVGSPSVRRRKPITADRLQMLLRDFACRLVRRSLGVRAGVVFGHSTLHQYSELVAGDDKLQYAASKQVEGLLNHQERFIVELNTTFGEPTPQKSRRVWLATSKQRVKALATAIAGRPSSDVRFLQIGSGVSKQLTALTYELFKSVTDLESGMAPASLPKPVKAALDAARARLGGVVVRDEEQLDGAEIHIGIRSEVVVRQMDEFLVLARSASE